VTAILPSPPALAVLLALALVLAGAARRHPRWPARRTVLGLAGLAALGAATATGLDERAHELLSAHMVQHALVQLVAAPLLVAAAPVRLALGVLPRAARRRLARALHRRWLRLLSHPLAGLSIFVAVLAAVHVPAVYDAALREPLAHGAEHACLLWAALALWAPVVGADPLPRRSGAMMRVAVLIAAMTAMGALGAVLAALAQPAYPAYVAPTLALGRDPLEDQVLAGGVMWVGGMVVVLPALLLLAWSALRAEERAQRVRDRLAGAAGGSGG
jgi:putative membrane protein